MSRSYRKFRIDDGLLSYEEFHGRQRPKITWSSEVKTSELAELYEVFRVNAFDLIRNDERTAIVHDAGSETIGISFGARRFYGITYGHNSPLSGRNLERYRKAKAALDRLVARHRPSTTTTDTADIEDAAERLAGTWRAAGDHGNGHTWYLQWKFADGEFEMRGYPPILQKGKFRVAQSGDGRLSLVLFGQSGNFGAEERTIEVTFDADGRAKIDQMTGFRKVAN